MELKIRKKTYNTLNKNNNININRNTKEKQKINYLIR